MAGALLRFTDSANGHHFEVTTDSNGKFAYIAVEPARYRLQVYRARHQQVTFPDFFLEWSHQPLLIEINLQKNTVAVTRQVILAESFGTEEPALATPEDKDVAKARAINAQLAAAKAYLEAGDWDRALSAAKAATEIDPNRDLPWAWLANIDCDEGAHSPTTGTSLLERCVQNYQYAIALTPNATYYNNLGVAYSSLKDWKNAASNFRAAIQLNPEHAGLYHQNLGAALMNLAQALPNTEALPSVQTALSEFSLAAAATPPVSEAYYWLGLCQLRLAAAEVPGGSYKLAGESFRRYLQLAPGGQYAEQARTMVAGLQDFAVGAGHSDPKP
jgi:tetratricopeptide (TPR) repeat protein